ncbi:MAG: IS21 family transposase, partial [Gammaproteobacteria bacterium]|nr:IS21 family transposase [Gammaproteobacteria bacterium]
MLLEDVAAMRELPATPFEASRVLATRASNLSLVRFDGNDYSVPVRCAHREVVAKGDCESV